MHILIGLTMAGALLYFWLLGHWFARVLVFLLLGAVFGMAGIAVGGNAGLGGAILLGPLGVVAAWFTAGIPIYYWRQRMAAAEAADKQLTRETIEGFNRRHGLSG